MSELLARAVNTPLEKAVALFFLVMWLGLWLPIALHRKRRSRHRVPRIR